MEKLRLFRFLRADLAATSRVKLAGAVPGGRTFDAASAAAVDDAKALLYLASRHY